jgi:hypothetical protein
MELFETKEEKKPTTTCTHALNTKQTHIHTKQNQQQFV